METPTTLDPPTDPLDAHSDPLEASTADPLDAHTNPLDLEALTDTLLEAPTIHLRPILPLGPFRIFQGVAPQK